MREILFRYVYKSEETGRIFDKVFSIEEIEEGIEKEFRSSIKRYYLARRDRYTGLKDKCKNMIFEGDIIFCEMKFIVEWSVDMCKFVLSHGINGKPFYSNCIIDSEIASTCKVIGNIHQNGDLIK